MMEATQRFLIQSLQKQTNLLKNLMSQAHERPSEDNVHKLRVATRRVRAILWILGNDPAGASMAEESQVFRKLGRTLGRQRELDIAIRDAEIYGLRTDDLLEERRKARRRTIKALKAKARKKRLRLLRKVLKDLRQAKEPSLLAPTLSKLRSRLESWDGKSIRADELHDFRIALKKVRYVLEAVEKPVDPLKKMQDLLGRVHDLQILEGRVGGKPQIDRDRRQATGEARKLFRPTLQFARLQLKENGPH